MAVRLGKKGIFFTAISLIIVGIMVLAFSSGPTDISTSKMETEQRRVELADSLVTNINEAFIPRLLTVSSYRALNALAFYVGSTGATISPDRLYEIFTDVVATGNVSGNHPIDEEIGIKIMENFTLADNLNRLSDALLLANNVKTKFNYSKAFIQVFQSNFSGPDNIMVNLSMEYSIDSGIAKWEVNKSWLIKVQVDGLFDPFWIYWEGKEIPIHFADYEVNYTKNWTSLAKFIDRMDYIPESDAPSYLMRMTGNLNGSKCCGIESPVNPHILNYSNEYWETYIDYCLYSNRCAPGPDNLSLYEIDKITNHTFGTRFYGYKLDPLHYVKYGIENSTGSDRVASSSFYGKPSVTSVQCHINGTEWLGCARAQWHSIINATRARCTHTGGQEKVDHVGFMLRNDFDNKIFYDVPDSTLEGDGLWYYDSSQVFINDSGDWSMRVRCEDIYGTYAIRTETWVVPWGLPIIEWYIDGEGNLVSKVTCVWGECGEVEIG